MFSVNLHAAPQLAPTDSHHLSVAKEFYSIVSLRVGLQDLPVLIVLLILQTTESSSMPAFGVGSAAAARDFAWNESFNAYLPFFWATPELLRASGGK